MNCEELYEFGTGEYISCTHQRENYYKALGVGVASGVALVVCLSVIFNYFYRKMREK